MRGLAALALLAIASPPVAAAEADAPWPLDEAILRDVLLKSDEFWPAMHAAEALTLAGHGRDVLAALAN